MIISAMTGVEYDDTCISKALSYIDLDGARRCAITGMLVGSACALQCCPSSIWLERVVHEGVVVVKFKG